MTEALIMPLILIAAALFVDIAFNGGESISSILRAIRGKR